jgi:hypothetical protein
VVLLYNAKRTSGQEWFIPQPAFSYRWNSSKLGHIHGTVLRSSTFSSRKFVDWALLSFTNLSLSTLRVGETPLPVDKESLPPFSSGSLTKRRMGFEAEGMTQTHEVW